jgi:hypothetical protein
MPRRRTNYLAWIVCSLPVLGCGDPVRTTAQWVRLRVVDAALGKPVVGAEVLRKSDFEAQHPLAEKKGQPPLSPKETHEHHRRFWEEQPWFRGTTDADGQADLVVEYTVLDRARGSTPPAWRDWVTGKPHLVRVKMVQLPGKREWTEPGESPEERVSLVMEPGRSADGRTVTVTVVEIHKPVRRDKVRSHRESQRALEGSATRLHRRTKRIRRARLSHHGRDGRGTPPHSPAASLTSSPSASARRFQRGRWDPPAGESV